ncbi:MAG: hypothetical protein J6X28_06060 [Bacilli bacterium]|nr:hypothetical protein [Bacilli bacterium]
MEFNGKNKKDIFMEEHKQEIKEELQNNSIVLSFAIAIIVVGIFSIFYDSGNGLLIGIAISTLLLTIIQCFSNGNTMLNILPIFTMLAFGFFDEKIAHVPGVSVLLDPKLQNIIIFLAFSLSFFTQAYKNVIYKHAIRKQEINSNNNKNKMMLAQLSTDKKMVTLAKRIKKVSEDRGIYDTQVNRAVDDLVDYIDTESFVTTVKSSLIIKGKEEKKTTFDIEEIEESILMSNGVNREREINANKQNEKSLDETEPEEDPFDFDFKFEE